MISALGNKDIEELNKINTDILKLTQEFKTVEIANEFMNKFTSKKGFLTVTSRYWATVENLRSVAQVNRWCNAKTHGKIPKNTWFFISFYINGFTQCCLFQRKMER